MSDVPFLDRIEACWANVAARIACDSGATESPHRITDSEPGPVEAEARSIVEDALFLWLCRRHGLAPCVSLMRELFGFAGRRYHPEVFAALSPAWPADGPAMPGDILGKAHERLLGRRLQFDNGRTVVRTSGELRKARGTYYTPPYIARYIVRETIARVVPDRLEAQSDRPAVLDPACGCGAFLLAAAGELRQRGMTPEEVAGCLHGMDLDPEAVLAAQRTLWLDIVAASESRDGRMEPASAGAIARRLVENIVCGDALADAATEGRTGRFDLVLGNPPYRRELDAKPLLDSIAASRLGRWRTARMDLWYYFVFRGLEFLRPGGALSFIVGSYWTSGRGAEKLIDLVRRSCHLDEVFLLDRLKVFSGVGGRHMIFRVVKTPPAPTRIKRPAAPLPEEAEPLFESEARIECFTKRPEELFRDSRLDLEPPDRRLDRLDRWTPLGQLGIVRQGIAENPATISRKVNERFGNRWRTGEGVFSLTPDEAAGLDLSLQERGLLRPYHDLCDLDRYWLAVDPSRRLIYSTAATCPDIERCPAVRDHLARFRPVLDARRETRQGLRPWWQLHWPRDELVWLAPRKVLSVQMGRRPAFIPAERPVYVPFSVNVFVPADTTREHVDYLAALLNSQLLRDWFRRHAKHRGVGLEINGNVLARAPIRTIDFTKPSEAARHDQLVGLVGQMLELSDRLRAAKDTTVVGWTSKSVHPTAESLTDLEVHPTEERTPVSSPLLRSGQAGTLALRETLAARQAEVDAEIDRMVDELYGGAIGD